MTGINSGVVLGLAGALSGGLMAALAFATSRVPGWRELRSFALVALASAAYSLFDLIHVVDVTEDTLLLGERFAMSASFLYGFAWIRYLAAADNRALRRLEQIAQAGCAAMMVLALIPGVLIATPIRRVPVEWFGVTYTMASATALGFIGILMMLASVLGTAFGMGRRWRDGWRARLPMIGAIALVAAGLNDTLSYLQVIAMPQILDAVTVVVVGTMGGAYLRRFASDAQRLEALSSRLEQEVASRTNELMEAQARATQHERLAGLGRIAAGVAHEINNPTMVIQQNLDRMQTLIPDAAPPELSMRIDRTRAASQRIADIVRQLLQTAQQPPRERANPVAFALVHVIDKAIAAASATVPGLRVAVAVPETLYAHGEPSSLEQVLINLLINSAHASEGTPGGGRVRIEGSLLDGRIRLAVTDNGSGIPASVRDRLFEPFTTSKPVGQGTGLGLAVSRNLMTHQGGTLSVGASSSAGTEMVLELPASDGTPASVPAAEVPAISNGTHEIRVLVIDDNDDLREVLMLQLDRFFVVDGAATVHEALALAANGHRYDAVLCDLMMPSGGAEAWLSRCTSIEPQLDGRTILLTGGPTTDAASALVEDRRDMVLFKPVDVADLRAMITRVSRPH